MGQAADNYQAVALPGDRLYDLQVADVERLESSYEKSTDLLLSHMNLRRRALGSL